MKKIASIIIVFVLACNMFAMFTLAEVDFSGGLLDGKQFYSLKNGSYIYQITDNNINTQYLLTKAERIRYSFSDEVNIMGYRIITSAPSIYLSYIKIIFYDANDNKISEVSAANNKGDYVSVSANNVKTIEIYNQNVTANYWLNEFNVYSLDPRPTQVKNVSVTDITYNGVSIGWDPIVGVLKYKVYLNGNLYGETTDTIYTISNLQPNTSYEVTVNAVNEAGEGPTSEPVTFTTLNLPVPSKVMSVTVKDITFATALISWDANAESEGVLKYIVYLNNKKHGETTNTEYTLDNLQPATTYTVQIEAVNIYGVGPQSDPIEFTTQEIPPDPATSARNIKIKSMTSTSATISWTPNPTSERIIKYVVYVNGEKHGETEGTEYVLENLKEGEKYTVTVAAVNALGEGPPSDPITFVPLKIADISNTIKTQDILSSIAILFTNLWPLIAFIVAVIAIVPITAALKQTITRRRSNA